MKFTLSHPLARKRAMAAVAEAPDGFVISIKPPTRSTEQNDKMWALLQDLSAQVGWYGQTLSKEEWKDVCTAAIKRQKVVPGIDGGFVVLGSRTSRMSKAELSEIIEFIYAFGATKGVNFTEQEHA